MEDRSTAASPVSLGAVALPAEHGGWGLIGEPLLLALLIAPSRAGFGVAAGCLAAFLLHHPLKLVLADLRRGASYPRTRIARRVAGVYAAIATLGLGAAALTSEGPFWAPLALAAPLAAVQLAYDARNLSRRVVPEIAGALALAATAPSILVAGGWPASAAALVWVFLAARAAGSVIYIRARLRRDRGLRASAAPPLVMNLAAALGAGALAFFGHAGWTVAAAFALLLGRAGWGLSPWHAAVRPRAEGLQELAFGATTTILFALGLLAR